MDKYNIDIIITTFNSEKYIKQTLESVFKQTYKNYKLIIVDDGSSDKTYSICEKYKEKFKNKIKLYRLKKNSGTAAIPRNYAIQKCKGDYVSFLDSDDIWQENKLQEQVNKINKSQKLYFTNCKYFDSDGEKSNLLFYLRIILQFIFTFLIKKNREWLFLYNPIIFSSVLIKRSIFKEIKFNISKELVGIEDLDLWFTYLRYFKSSIYYEKKPLVNIRRRQHSLHSNYNHQTIKSINMISKIYLNKKSFINIYIFLISIAYKAIRPLIKKIFNFFKINFSQLILIFIFILYFIFYSPFFKFVGKKLLVENFTEKKINTIVVYSGPGYETYVNEGYKLRYKDLTDIYNINPSAEFYILGRIQVIPEQKILEGLLLSKGVNQQNINIIYDDLGSSANNLENLFNILKEKEINEILIVTAPYFSKRTSLLWKKYNNTIGMFFYKTIDWPSDDFSIFEKFNYKKTILYEYLSIVYNFLKKNF
tara:strand:+ start:2952 stop:4385 length:1434 start_codon:yes stop_codon:yes gene_type:complete